MFTRCRAAFDVIRCRSFRYSVSLVLQSPKRASFFCVATQSWILRRPSRRSFFSFAFPSRPTSFLSGSINFSMVATSFNRSSSRMISRSRTGSTLSSTWVATSPSSVCSNVRHTWKIASTDEMCERNALPRPAPSEAPLTSPAMSIHVRKAGTTDLGFTVSCSSLKSASGTSTRASVGSIVQKGKFSAGTVILHMMLKVVDLPTLGRPTTPALTLLLGLPSRTRGGGASAFLGGIVVL
mmetsp:Transcript_26706/g.67939  ORF Transcript_26706/g.67939 Transcript_26706/m.67939 type:complete len:238 (+) Transcript_26706:816-1529(+)